MCTLSRKEKKVPVESGWRQHETAAAPGMTGPSSAAAGAPAGAWAGAPSHHGTTAAANLPGPALNTAGPHRHDILNKLDPTVDSGSGGIQITGPGTRTSAEHYGPTPTNAPATAAVPQSAYNQGAAYNYGQQHNSGLTNQVDPRVDSTRHTASGPGRQGYAAAPGMSAPEGAYGPHGSRIANAADPRVDSDVDGRAATHGHHGHHGGYQGGGYQEGGYQGGGFQGGAAAYPGPAPNTAGPHRSDLLNKLDPSVDSKPAGTNTRMREY